MRLRINARLPGQRVLWTDGALAYVADGHRFGAVDLSGQATGRTYAVGSGRTGLRGAVCNLLGRFRATRQLLRLGIHHLWPLPDGAFVVIVRKQVLRVEADGRCGVAFDLPRGNKPAHRGVCVTPDGRVYLVEYAMNLDRKLPMAAYRSDDQGRSYQRIHEFSPGVVRHIHFIQWDPFGQCLWLGTGDADSECLMFRSTNDGDSWEKIGGGSQFWRAVGVAFRPEALYWGTDAGSDAGMHPNHVMRLDRSTLQLDKVLELQGPCHGNATLKDGTLLVSTGVEGGQNEKGHHAHLWASRDGRNWQELFHFAKDCWPLIVQFGVIRFPQGLEQSAHAAFTCMGLADGGETTYVAAVEQS